MEMKGILTLLNMSITGGMVVVFVLVLRLLMRRMPKRYLCLLWLIPFLRLLVPAVIPSPLSLLPVNTRPVVEIQAEDGGTLPFLDTGIAPVDNAVNFIILSSYGTDSAIMGAGPGNETGAETGKGPVDAASVMGLIWALGAVLFAAGNGVRYRKLKKQTEAAVPGGDGAYYSDTLDMPMVLGVIKPRILLPVMFLKDENSEEKEFVLAHEAAHIQRHDPIMKLFAFAALTIHWFNPLVWAAYFLLCKDMEMACDEAVMECLGEEKKKGYSLALLNFEERRSALLLPLAFGESNTKSRIKNILNYKKPGFWVSLGAVVLLGAAAVTLLTNPDGNGIFGSNGPASVGIIGGADGPTSIFLAGKLDGQEITIGADSSSTQIIGGADGPTSIFIAGKTDGSAPQAEEMDVEAAKKAPYGTGVELDYVSVGKISMHGYFGYMIFEFSGDNVENGKAELTRSVTLSETGRISMQGDSYTEIVGSENGALIVTNAYAPKADKRFFLYSAETNTLDEQTNDAEFRETILEAGSQGLFKDAYIEDRLVELAEQVHGSFGDGTSLLYGPVVVPEFDSNVYGFLAADGGNLEDVWYGLWYADMGKIVKTELFP